MLCQHLGRRFSFFFLCVFGWSPLVSMCLLPSWLGSLVLWTVCRLANCLCRARVVVRHFCVFWMTTVSMDANFFIVESLLKMVFYENIVRLSKRSSVGWIRHRWFTFWCCGCRVPFRNRGWTGLLPFSVVCSLVAWRLRSATGGGWSRGQLYESLCDTRLLDILDVRLIRWDVLYLL